MEIGELKDCVLVDDVAMRRPPRSRPRSIRKVTTLRTDTFPRRSTTAARGPRDRMIIIDTVARSRSGLETVLSAAILRVVDIKICVRKGCVGRRAGAGNVQGAEKMLSSLSSLFLRGIAPYIYLPDMGRRTVSDIDTI